MRRRGTERCKDSGRTTMAPLDRGTSMKAGAIRPVSLAIASMALAGCASGPAPLTAAEIAAGPHAQLTIVSAENGQRLSSTEVCSLAITDTTELPGSAGTSVPVTDRLPDGSVLASGACRPVSTPQ